MIEEWLQSELLKYFENQIYILDIWEEICLPAGSLNISSTIWKVSINKSSTNHDLQNTHCCCICRNLFAHNLNSFFNVLNNKKYIQREQIAVTLSTRSGPRIVLNAYWGLFF